MIPITCNIITFHMPPELLCLSIESLQDSIPSDTVINLINNGDPFDTDPLNYEKPVCITEQQLQDLRNIAGKSYGIEYHDLKVYNNGPSDKLSETWNRAIDWSNTDWLMISNDDVFWKNGWYEIFCKKADEGCLLVGCGFSCFLIHKKLVEQIGKFDERLKQAYCEDTDFLLRLIKAGNIRISQEFRRYDFDCELYGYFNHIKRDFPKINSTLMEYWKSKRVGRPFPPGPNYRIFREIWGFGNKDPEVDKILKSYKFKWKYK